MLVAGEWIDAKDGNYIEVENPATGEHFARVPDVRSRQGPRRVQLDRARLQFAARAEHPGDREADGRGRGVNTHQTRCNTSAQRTLPDPTGGPTRPSAPPKFLGARARDSR